MSAIERLARAVQKAGAQHRPDGVATVPSLGLSLTIATALLRELREPSPEMVEAMCVARCDLPFMWPDAFTEGLSRIERMKAEKAYAAAIDAILQEER